MIKSSLLAQFSCDFFEWLVEKELIIVTFQCFSADELFNGFGAKELEKEMPTKYSADKHEFLQQVQCLLRITYGYI